MNHGLDALSMPVTFEDTQRLLVAAFEHHKPFFARRTPHIYEQLRRMVGYCRHHLRLRNQALTQQMLREDLLRAFGVRVLPPYDRQLSLLAGLIRHVLVSHMQQLQWLGTGDSRRWFTQNIRRRFGAAETPNEIALHAFDAALRQLAEQGADTVRLLELRYFARLSTRDIALELNAPLEGIEGDLRFAKAWLQNQLQFSRS